LDAPTAASSDRIWRLHAASRDSPYCGLRLGEWGERLHVPDDLEQQIRRTPRRRWRGARLLMSSTHDPRLPQLYRPRRILEAALPHGAKFAAPARSTPPLQNLDLYVKHRDQVLLTSSIPTLDGSFAKIAELKAPPPSARLAMLRKAKEAGPPRS